MPRSARTQKDVNPPPSVTTKVDRQFVTALSRGLDILRCFTATRTELGTADIAAITGLPQPTVWRLCHTLTKCGFLVPSGANDKLKIGLAVLGLGVAALSSLGPNEAIYQEMQRLALDFHAAVSLAIPDRAEMLIVQRARGDGALLLNLHVGSRLPMEKSSFGWAYLATLTAKERAALLSELAHAHQPEEWAHIEAKLSEVIANYESTGYVVNASGSYPNVNAIAVPAVIQGTRRTMVINCGGPATTVSVEQLENEVAPRLVELADAIKASHGIFPTTTFTQQP